MPLLSSPSISFARVGSPSPPASPLHLHPPPPLRSRRRLLPYGHTLAAPPPPLCPHRRRCPLLTFARVAPSSPSASAAPFLPFASRGYIIVDGGDPAGVHRWALATAGPRGLQRRRRRRPRRARRRGPHRGAALPAGARAQENL